MKLLVILDPSGEGGFTACIPSLPGCVSEGETEVEAMGNIREAALLYLEPTEEELQECEGCKRMELAL